MVDSYCLAKLASACVIEMMASGEPVCRNLSLVHYDCRICAVKSEKEECYFKEDYNVWSGPRKEGVLRPRLYIRYSMGKGNFGCWPVTRTGPSYTELLLGCSNQ